MNTNRQNESSAGMPLGDIYYVLFRHKTKIILLTLLGLATAAAIYFYHPPPYESQAELLIKYVPESMSWALEGENSRVLMPESRGRDIINAEIRILTSLDLAQEVVTNMGATRILAGAGGGSNVTAAAALILRNLEAKPADQDSSVILVTFKHPDPQIVQPVLQQLIDLYFQKHYEIHSAAGQYDDALSREQVALRVQLNDTEQQLARLKNKANVLSLDDTRKGLAERISRTQAAILDAQAELSGYEAMIKHSDNARLARLQTTNAPAPVPADRLNAYNSICAHLDVLRQKEQFYFMQGFTSANLLVREVDAQIADTQKAKTEIEQQYPQIAALGTVASDANARGSGSTSVADVRTQLAQIAALNAKIKAWNVQLDQLQTEATNLNNLAPSIAQLEQTRAIQQANYQTLSESVEKSHIDEALITGKAPNIKWVQMPSSPVRNWTQTDKVVILVPLGALALGLALAFVTELFLDRSIKRPLEIETKLRLPLFLSIPNVGRNGHTHLPATAQGRQLQLNNPGANGHLAITNGEPHQNGQSQVPWPEKKPALKPFYEALRDRLILHFELKNLTHKPKLLAVTSANPGAGVSTIAGGLAASLSETGDGNVLLVDMNLADGVARHFHRGATVCGLDSALHKETKQEALVQENLYFVSGNSNHTEVHVTLPKRFAAIVPKLKASDFDYIIFDMPPISPTSVTSRLARFMDATLLVVESEKTDREVVTQATQWLAESGASIKVVLNKTRKYIPERLQQEFQSNG